MSSSSSNTCDRYLILDNDFDGLQDFQEWWTLPTIHFYYNVAPLFILTFPNPT
ncbi:MULTISPECIES: hypothetical protein [Nostocales]|uniref:Uncharacterized protein n=3 Tax=Nostocales TaxID=1161 RepID=A0A8S9T1E8_9CYAN|nr:hypothetical protein [Tolypothrix bouteillei]KAF3886240.1 hypothetical protein DA73_0400012705 [Tolypothrix bouteillei VB521301]